MKYKKYIVFGMDTTAPEGGLADIDSSFSGIKQARDRMEHLGRTGKDTYIVNRDTWEIIESDAAEMTEDL